MAWVLGHFDGGFGATAWGPAGIVAVWLAVAVWAFARPQRVPRLVAVALVAYGALALWTLASVLWAATPQRALEAAGRTGLYGAVLAVALVPRWPRASLRRLLVLVAAGGVTLAAVTFLRVVASDDPSSFFIDGRLIAPAGYVNAAAGLWVIALPVLVGLAAGGVRSPLGRGAALVGAGLVLELSLLSQSRGALIAMAAALVVVVVLSPDRGGIVLAAVAVIAAAVLSAPSIVDVRGAPDVAVLAERIDHAAGRVLLTLVGLAVAAAAWQLLLRAMPSSARRAIGGRWPGVVVSVVPAVIAVVAALVVVGNPISWAGERVDQALHADYATVAPTGDRLTGSLASGRGDMYRVAVDAWRDRPLRGIGAEDFQPAYFQGRSSLVAARYVHSLPLGILVGLGVVGFGLALAALAALLAAATRALRRVAPATRTLTAVAVAGFAGWFVQSAWDWTWEFPALTMLALVLLAVAVRSTDEAGTPPSAELLRVRELARQHGVEIPDDDGASPRILPRTVPSKLLATAGVAGAMVASVGFASVGLATHYFERATARAASQPEQSIRDFDRAARLNPLDGDATLSRAIVVRRLGDFGGWRWDLNRTIERSPKDWLAHLQLGIADAMAGDREAAITQVRRARALNPRQGVIQEVLDDLREGRAVDPADVEAQLAARHAQLVKSTAGR
ncbi:MAG: O-antigen ligase family protein [Patulibacter sp.]|nr:O-antigen ligase family protein [Patulibacter sp.]